MRRGLSIVQMYMAELSLLCHFNCQGKSPWAPAYKCPTCLFTHTFQFNCDILFCRDFKVNREIPGQMKMERGIRRVYFIFCFRVWSGGGAEIVACIIHSIALRPFQSSESFCSMLAFLFVMPVTLPRHLFIFSCHTFQKYVQLG